MYSKLEAIQSTFLKDGTIKKLIRNSGLGDSPDEQMRTQYLHRYSYANLKPLENKTDIHALAKQISNISAMTETLF
jgi:hypothetical protein